MPRGLKTLPPWWSWVLLAGLVVWIVASGRAHGAYDKWLAPNGSKCCTDVNRECRPARAYLGDDGIHYVWLSGKWKAVPPHAVISRVSPDGRSHVCTNSEDMIFCFVFAQPRS